MRKSDLVVGGEAEAAPQCDAAFSFERARGGDRGASEKGLRTEGRGPEPIRSVGAKPEPPMMKVVEPSGRLHDERQASTFGLLQELLVRLLGLPGDVIPAEAVGSLHAAA